LYSLIIIFKGCTNCDQYCASCSTYK